ncbi:MAG: putative baseplate assembly protein [Novosphingobium sp.]
MSAPWWGRDRPLDAAPTLDGLAPVLHPAGRGAVVRQLLHRAAAYTPDWTQHRPGDPGFALTQLFAEMAEPLLTRINRLPEKAFIEFLRVAGIGALPELPASTWLAFAIEPAAPGPVIIAEGTQLSVDAADGGDDPVVFETERTLSAAPVTLAAVFRRTGGLPEQIDFVAAQAEDGLPWRPFAPRPKPGAELLIGLAGRIAPRGTFTIAFELATNAGAPPPAASGAEAGAVPPPPLLKWDVLDGAGFEPAQVIRDQTHGLSQSGIVELKLPPRWRAGRPGGIDLPEPMFWLRLRLAHGSFAKVPTLRALHVNAVEAAAIQTVRDEVLEFVPGSDRRRLRLSRSPVLAGSLQLVVLEPTIDGDVEEAWSETGNLAQHGAEDRVYVLDAATGELGFGDNIHGMRLPLGFRNIIARRYAMGGGLGGRVEAKSEFALVRAIPYVTSVTNPQRASGGKAAETLDQTRLRGPLELRSGGRAVASADYELLATRAPGGDVARAHAISGHDARFPGSVIPGSVTVLVVSSDKGAEQPLADSGTLAAVGTWLTKTVAPAGIQVIAATPQFQRIGVRASVAVLPSAEVGQVVARALECLQTWLHPLSGGPDGTGWPFGGVIRHQSVTRMLLDRVPGLAAVPSLNLVVDGVLRGACQDWAIPAHALIWPEGHEVIPVAAEASA